MIITALILNIHPVCCNNGSNLLQNVTKRIEKKILDLDRFPVEKWQSVMLVASLTNVARVPTTVNCLAEKLVASCKVNAISTETKLQKKNLMNLSFHVEEPKVNSIYETISLSLIKNIFTYICTCTYLWLLDRRYALISYFKPL